MTPAGPYRSAVLRQQVDQLRCLTDFLQQRWIAMNAEMVLLGPDKDLAFAVATLDEKHGYVVSLERVLTHFLAAHRALIDAESPQMTMTCTGVSVGLPFEAGRATPPACTLFRAWIGAAEAEIARLESPRTSAA